MLLNPIDDTNVYLLTLLAIFIIALIGAIQYLIPDKEEKQNGNHKPTNNQPTKPKLANSRAARDRENKIKQY